jgi:hypothetical protein
MKRKIFAVRQRRAELLARIASQREQVAEFGAHWQGPLALADKGLAVARFLRSNPLLAAGVSAFLMINRRSTVGLGKIAWKGWKLYRLARSFMSKPPNNP